MRNFIRKFRVLLISLFLVFLSFYLLFTYDLIPRDSNPVSQKILIVYSYLLGGIESVSDNIYRTWEEYISIRDARRENRQLKKELARQRNLIQEALEYQLENDRLRNLLSFKKRKSLRMVAGEVIGKDSSRLFESILLNKGGEDELTRNMAVLTPEGVVGHIIECTPVASKVLLISDINSSVSVIVQRNRTQALVVGQGRGVCRTKFLSNSADIREGDVVVTSGLGGIYPKGLMVGRLKNIVKKTAGLFLEAELLPGADLRRLEEVLIVIQKPELGVSEQD
jgi:rod shape-determining protein MreC